MTRIHHIRYWCDRCGRPAADWEKDKPCGCGDGWIEDLGISEHAEEETE